jgi:hypothetical protein
MRGSLKYLLLVVALFAGALLFACSSSDDDGDNGSAEPTADQSADDGDSDDDNGNTDDGDSDDDDVSDALRSLAEQFGVSEVKVTYDFTAPGLTDTDPDSEVVSQMVLYSKPPDRWRMDIISPDGDISMISDGESTLICAAEGDDEGACFASPLDDALAVPFLNIFTDPGEIDGLIDEALGVDVSRSSREIAGQDANCFSFSASDDGTTGSGEYCFRDDGVLLLLRADALDGDDDFSMEAVEVSDSVSDSDLEAPYDILDFGDILP